MTFRSYARYGLELDPYVTGVGLLLENCLYNLKYIKVRESSLYFYTKKLNHGFFFLHDLNCCIYRFMSTLVMQFNHFN